MQPQEYDLLYKICLIGDSGVGKSCIVTRYADKEYKEKFLSTIGVDFRTKTLEEDGKVVKLHIWDTAGQERFRSLTANAFRGTHGLIFVYDLTDRESFVNIAKVWDEEFSSKVNESVIKLLVGNKSDLGSTKRAVSFQEAQEYAREMGMPFIETSAKDDVHIQAAFMLMVATIREAGDKGAVKDASDVNNIKLPMSGESLRPKRTPCRCG